MGSIKITWNLKQVKEQGVKIDSNKVKGVFIWIVNVGVVDRIVGYRLRRGFIADYCYYTGNNWIKDLFYTLRSEKGLIRITRYI
jgi:hypothetical protein